MESQQTPSNVPARKSNCFLFGCGGCLMVILTIAFLIAAGTFLLTFLDDWDSDDFVEIEEVSGYPDWNEKKIVIIPIHGVIQYGSNQSGISDPEQFAYMMKKAEDDPSVAAVIISLDTPGGEVNAADEIYRTIRSFRQRTKRPVIALMRSIATSGGYYVAAACDKIIAGEMTLTGSIGVIISGYNFSELLKKIGVSGEVYKSGTMKDLLNPARERTKEEADLIQELVGECYQVFARIVAESRKLPLEKITNGPIGDGRIYHGKKALSYGMVDQLGYLPEAVMLCEELTGEQKGTLSVIRYNIKMDFLDFLLSSEGPLSRGVNLNLPISERGIPMLKPGRFYYLPGGTE